MDVVAARITSTCTQHADVAAQPESAPARSRAKGAAMDRVQVVAALLDLYCARACTTTSLIDAGSLVWPRGFHLFAVDVVS